MTLNQDYQEIAGSLGNYFDGFYDGDVGKLRKIFHPNCHLYTATTGSLADADIETIYGRVSDRENPGDRNDPRFDQPCSPAWRPFAPRAWTSAHLPCKDHERNGWSQL